MTVQRLQAWIIRLAGQTKHRIHARGSLDHQSAQHQVCSTGVGDCIRIQQQVQARSRQAAMQTLAGPQRHSSDRIRHLAAV